MLSPVYTGRGPRKSSAGPTRKGATMQEMMRTTPSFFARALLLCFAILVVPRLLAQAPSAPPSDPVVGTWTGQLHYGAESKAMGLRSAFIKGDRLGAVFGSPHIKLPA